MDDAQKLLANTNISHYVLYGKYWYEILLEIGHTIVDLIVNHEEVALPFNMGTLVVTTKNQELEPNKMKIDPVATKKLWESNPELKDVQYVYHINDDLTYNNFRWLNCSKAILSHRVTYINWYRIRMVRSAKNKLSAASKKGVRYILSKELKKF